MPLCENVRHIYEPNPLACGQAAIAMATGVEVDKIIELCGTEREIDLKTVKRVFESLGVKVFAERREFKTKEDLSEYAFLSLETPKCWHWSLYVKGRFYDPVYGEISETPPSNRKYFWQLKNI